MSVLEIWGAEYQENNALLIKPESTELFLAMADRENCPASLLGKVSGDGRVTVKDSRDGSVPYDLPLKVNRHILQEIRQDGGVWSSKKRRFSRSRPPGASLLPPVRCFALRALFFGPRCLLCVSIVLLSCCYREFRWVCGKVYHPVCSFPALLADRPLEPPTS